LQWSNFTFRAQSGFGSGGYVLMQAANVSGALGVMTTGTVVRGGAQFYGALGIDTTNGEVVLTVRDAPSGAVVTVQ
jgi:hypothetical protein